MGYGFLGAYQRAGVNSVQAVTASFVALAVIIIAVGCGLAVLFVVAIIDCWRHH